MSALREAAQQALEALEFLADEWGFTHKANRPERWRAIEALRAALAQQEQEPVGWASREELARIKDFDATIYANEDFDGAAPLYSAPPSREWEGLTDEDMEELLPLYSDPNSNEEMLEFAAAIEAKLKEKNA